MSYYLQALGAGSTEMGSELMEAPEDEETFDILNDETFGDMGDGKEHFVLRIQAQCMSCCVEHYEPQT